MVDSARVAATELSVLYNYRKISLADLVARFGLHELRAKKVYRVECCVLEVKVLRSFLLYKKYINGPDTREENSSQSLNITFSQLLAGKPIL